MFVNNMINVSETIGKPTELNNKMKVGTEVFNPLQLLWTSKKKVSSKLIEMIPG